MWLSLSESGRATPAAPAAALVLATSERLASTGHIERSREALAGVVLAIPAQEVFAAELEMLAAR